VPERGDLGEPAAFPQDDLRHEAAIGLHHFRAEKFHQRAEFVDRCRRRPRRRQAFEQGRQGAQDDLLQQILLVLGEQIDGALGDAGAPRDVVEASAGETVFGKFRQRRVEDRLPAFFSGGGSVLGADGFDGQRQSLSLRQWRRTND